MLFGVLPITGMTVSKHKSINKDEVNSSKFDFNESLKKVLGHPTESRKSF